MELEHVMEEMANGSTSRQAIQGTNFSRGRVERAFIKYQNFEDIHAIKNRGAKRRIPQEVEDQIAKESSIRDLAVDSHTKATYKARVIEIMKAMDAANPRQVPRSASYYQFSNKVIRASLRRTLPEEVLSACHQNKRRRDASYDAFNAVSFVSTLKAMELDDLYPELLSNWDVTGLVLGEKAFLKKVYLARGSKKKLKARGLGAGSTAPSLNKKRSCQVGALTSADGRLLLGAIFIKQTSMKEVKVYNFSKPPKISHWILRWMSIRIQTLKDISRR